MEIWEGTSGCIKCNSYRIYKKECQVCGTNQTEWYRNNMISNLEMYGFKKSFFFKKWKLGDLVVKPKKDTTNMLLIVDGKELLLNLYGDYKYFKKSLDGLLGKANIRNIKIDKVLNEK